MGQKKIVRRNEAKVNTETVSRKSALKKEANLNVAQQGFDDRKS